MVAYLLSEEESEGAGEAAGAEAPRSAVLEYLKKLPPPAVDLEMRALCTHDEDEEGRDLVRRLLAWLGRHIASGDNFEILQAYLHRMLAIHITMITKTPQLVQELRVLQGVHAKASNRFRHLVQKNLCLLKIMANLPIA